MRSARLFITAATLLFLAPTPGRQARAAMGPIVVTAADLDDDPLCTSCDDVVVADRTADAVSVRFGNGDGTFDPPVNLAASRPVAVATGDCDGDGDRDVFALSARGDLHILVNQLIESTPQAFLPALGSPMAVGRRAVFLLARDYQNQDLDLDGDVVMDLVVARKSTGPTILLGTGSCQFAISQQDGTAGPGVAAAAAPFDGNAGLDLAVLDPRRSGRYGVSILLNDGAAGFPLTCSLPSCTQHDGRPFPTMLVARDLNSDGLGDVLITYHYRKLPSPNEGLIVARGLGPGALSAFNIYGGGGLRAVAMAVEDFTGDGALDVVIANRRSDDIGSLQGSFPNSVTFTLVDTVPVERHPVAVAAGQFNSGTDSFLDVVVMSNRRGLSLCLGAGDGNFDCSPVP